MWRRAARCASVFLFLIAVSETAIAQCPTPGDPFLSRSGTHVCPFQSQPPFTISWNASTSVPNATYEVLLATYSGYCPFEAAAFNYQFSVVGTTTATSFQIDLPVNVVWVSGVRVKGCADTSLITLECVSDRLETPPGKPTILSAAPSSNQVGLQFSIPDDLAPTTLQRAGT